MEQVVRWFRKRRSVSFKKVEHIHNRLRIKLECTPDIFEPDLMVRVHNPESDGNKKRSDFSMQIRKKIDIPFSGKLDTTLLL
jgi:hypothetical protein